MVLMKLFTSSTCPYCPKAEKVVSKIAKEEGVLAIELPVNTDEGMKEALKYGIRAYLLWLLMKPISYLVYQTRMS